MFAKVVKLLLVGLGCRCILRVDAQQTLFLSRDRPDGSDLLMELEQSWGVANLSVSQMRISLLEAALRPKFRAVSKNVNGLIGPTAARYLLHRIFVEHYGWYVNGLAPGGESFNSSAPTTILKNRAGAVPDHVPDMWEAKLSGHGFSLHEVAQLAATLETLVHDEAVQRLRAVYRTSNVDVNQRITAATIHTLVERYMVIVILGGHFQALTEELLDKTVPNIEILYPSWQDTLKFVVDVQRNVLSGVKPDTHGSEPTYSFDDVERIIEEIGQSYSRWQDKECQDLKKNLMKLEDGDSGRVLLKTFYQTALGGMWQFSERVENLRHLGSLEESIPGRPSVLIANYIYSPSNCVAGSSFYNVCCIDYCESLLGHIEEHIAAPYATTRNIAAVVQSLPSATVPAPRVLPGQLLSRLEEIAAHHGGHVPIHGRLFAQWLHHAYPLECPFPHLSGTTKPATQDEWMEEYGIDPLAEDWELAEHVEELQRQEIEHSASLKDAPQDIPWNPEEELFVIHSDSQKLPSAHSFPCDTRKVVMVGLLLSFAVSLVRSVQSSLKSTDLSEKMYV